MGVDYSANFGIGVQIDIESMGFESNGEVYDFLETILENTEYKYFETDASGYTGNIGKFYIIINNPFSESYDIIRKVRLFDLFLSKNNVKYFGYRIDIVGGLRIS
jgi:hypothetical protein